MAGNGTTPGGSSPNSDDINDRLAEIAAELAAEAKFKEPSAAERSRRVAGQAKALARPGPAVPKRAGRLRRWRNRKLAAELRKPVAEPGRPARPASKPPLAARRSAARVARAGSGPVPDRGYATPARRSTPAKSVLTVVLILILLLAVSLGIHTLLHRGTGRPRGRGGSHAPTSPPTPVPTFTPLFTTADPFANSGAQSFAAGATGIVPPAAHTTGQFSAAEVASAYRDVRQLLIAQNLDWPTLRGGTPAAFVRLLVPDQRRWFDANLAKTGLKGGLARSSRVWVTSFAPGTTSFVGSVVKVHGLPMTASVAQYSGRTTLRVFADYLFVYAVQDPTQPASRTRIVARIEDTVYFADWTGQAGQLQPWIGHVDFSDAGAQCGITTGFVHPAFPAVGPGKVKPSGAPVDPYNLNTPAGTPNTCQPVTRT